MKKDYYYRELFLGLLVIITIYVLAVIFWNPIKDLLMQSPILNLLYKAVIFEIERKSVIGLSTMTFVGSLFFIAYPAEVLFLLYTKVGYGIIYVSAIMLLFTMIAQFVNYSMGYFINEKLLSRFIKHKKMHLDKLKKYGYLFIIILNILPLPADILSVILGVVKYDFRKAMFYTLIGKVLKFLFLGILILIMQGSLG